MEISREVLEESDLIESTFNFWFNHNQHIRSPFPAYIHPMLKHDATKRFFNWVDGLHEDAKEELNDEAIAEKFEEIIFETGRSLVRHEDEKITILYPFLPRVGDKIYQDEQLQEGESRVIDRQLIEEGDNAYMEVQLEKTENHALWETRFELPGPIN